MKTNLIIELFKYNCIKKGSFTLKNGNESPIYINLKNILSHPHILNMILKLMYDKINCKKINKILGIPYGGLILSNCLTSKFNIPSLLVRKEIKSYGMKKNIDGEYSESDNCIIIEDTITTGSSLLKFLKLLDKEIIIDSILVVCDRRLKSDHLDLNKLEKYNIESIFTIYDVIETLYITSKIDNMFYNKLQNYFNYKKDMTLDKNILEYRDNKLVNNINKKNTNLSLVIDFKCFKKILKTIELYGENICSIKIYSDLIDDFNNYKIEKLIEYKKKYNILIEEGKQFSKEQNIFFQEFTNEKKIFKWVDIVSLTEFHPVCIFNIIDTINKKHNKNIMINLDCGINTKAKYLINNNNNIISVNLDYSIIENDSYFNNIVKFKTYSTKNYIGKYVFYISKNIYYLNDIYVCLKDIKFKSINLWLLS